MVSFDWILELVLVGLLAITLVHAIRLEQALRSLNKDRAALGDAIASFDDSARQAEAGIGRLHIATAESAQLLTQRVEQGGSLRDDLAFLIDRGEAIADRLDGLVRAGRPLAAAAPPVVAPPPDPPPALPAPIIPAGTQPAPGVKIRSKAERDLLLALQSAQ